jgi:hypothetical protein
VAGFTADVYVARVESSVANASTIINYTITANTASFNGIVVVIVMSIVGTELTEAMFRLSDGSLSRDYILGVSSELQMDSMTTFISDSVIILNNPMNPVQPGVYDFNIGALIIGTTGGDGDTPLVQESSVGLIEVLEGIDFVLSRCMIS